MMPIVSRALDYAREQSNGRFRCRVSGADAKGRAYVHGPFWADTVVAAEGIRDTVVWDTTTPDYNDLLAWVQAKNTVASFDLTNRDITEEQGEDFIAITFAEAPGDEAIQLAWWVESLTPPVWAAIRTRIGWTSEQGTNVQDRAIALLAAEPLYDTIIEAP